MRYFLLFGIALSLFQCEKGNPVINENDIITLHIAPSTITNFGDSAVVTVVVTHADGRPVLDGTRILLRTTGGVIAPEVVTQNGRAVTPFTSDAGTGTFTITAQSGQVGLEGEISADITVVDRSVEVGNLILNLNPSNISHAGGSVQLNAVVQDPGGFPLDGVSIVFSSNYGRLASNGTLRTTDADGRASDTLILDRLPTTVTQVEVTVQVAGETTTKNLTVTTNENPTPQITFSPGNPQVGETVFFDGSTSTDSDGVVQSYFWNFGDGTSAEGVTAEHAYGQARDYQVTLRVRDDAGAEAATAMVVPVGANQPPTAEFSISPDEPRVGDLITFNAGASSDPDGTISEYRWTLGNGIERTGQVVTFAYAAARTYQVTLTVTDNGGATGTATQSVTVAGNIAPMASFTFSPGNPKIGERVAFDASGSTDEDSGIKSYDWSFGDNFTGTGIQANHVYNQSGSFVVTLTVTDNELGKGYATQVVTVGQNELPNASFTLTPTSPRIHQLVTFDGTASDDPDGSIKQFQWSFGDGSGGTGSVIQHTFEAAQDFAVTLTVIDNLGASKVASKIVTVVPGGAPTALLKVSPDSLLPPGGQVFLDATGSTDPENALSQLRFTFRATGPNHVTTTIPAGTAPVRLAEIQNALQGDQILFEVEVLDTEGNTSRAIQQVLIGQGSGGTAPTAALNLTPDQLMAPGGQVILDATATTDPESPLNQLDFQFSSLVAGSVNVAISGSGPLQTATLSGGTVGDIVTFLLTVEDPTGLQSHISRNLTLVAGNSNQAPTAMLTTTPASMVPAGATGSVVVDARASSDPEDSNALLSFGFDGVSTNPATVFTFTPSGENGLALLNLTNLVAGDQLVITVTVTDTGTLSDQASVILTVQ
ncbi:MAG: PKD domain-containing protein [Acidobacteria bacterium]|nr:PKD domain-containing protein [Acidobacteriota bacterium]MCB9399449.1 PKD domain-containing protein [Acidobacteriota bacterium]